MQKKSKVELEEKTNTPEDKLQKNRATIQNALKDKQKYIPYKDLSVDALLSHIRKVGSNIDGIEKLIGYLLLDIIEPKTGKSAKEIAEEFESKGMAVLILSGAESASEKGAIYVYHKEGLQRFLNRYRTFLREEDWPLDAEAFVRTSAKESPYPGTLLHSFIDYSFADHRLLGRMGGKLLEAISDDAKKEYSEEEVNKNLEPSKLLNVNLRDVLNMNRFRKPRFHIDVCPTSLDHRYEGSIEIRVRYKDKPNTLLFALIFSKETGKIHLKENYQLEDDPDGTATKKNIERMIHTGGPLGEGD